MTLAERLTKRITIDVDGKAWPLLFSHSTLLDIEAATGLDVLAGEFQPIRVTAKTLRTMLSILLTAAGCQCSLGRIGKLLCPGALQVVRGAVWAAWRAAMPDPAPQAPDGAESPKPLTWLEAWAIADQDIGLTAEEWLAMTPRMVEALKTRRLEQMRQWELMIGMVISTGVNHSFHAPKEPLAPAKFMLHPWPEEITPKNRDDLVMNFFKSYKQRGLVKSNGV